MSKLSEAIIERLGHAKRDGIRLQMDDVKRIIEEVEAKLKPRKASDLTDEEWFQSLEQEPHLKGVAIRREIAACQFWCKNNRREATRRTIINWLNKAERVVTLKASGAQHATGLKPPAPAGPEGWEQWLKSNMPDEEHSAHGQLTASYNCKKFSMMPVSWQTRCREELTAQTA